ncbi:MAG: hypothetical protein IKP88_02570 [Lachnospiraceae bacterium]|nr:hypothetical protein [Lachnospiraceae bacterium]
MNAGQIVLGLIILETHIVLLVLLYTFISILFQRQKIGYSLALLIVTGIEYIIWQLFLELKTELPGNSWEGDMRLEVRELFLLQALITGMAVITTTFVYKRKQKHISKASIKEGIDTVPAGILFYWPEGLVKLVNTKMETLAVTLTGEKVYNGAEFWDKLCELDIKRESQENTDDIENDPGTEAENIPKKERKNKKKNRKIAARSKKKSKKKNRINESDKEENAVVQLPDGKLFSFRKTVCKMYNHSLIEIVASDVSEEWLLHNQLKEEQEKADRLNERLKELNSTIEVMTAEKEILQTKSMVHDEWGKTLIMSRRYLSKPDEELGYEILKQWKLNAMLMKDEEDSDVTDEYSVTLKDIRTMGLELKMRGTLPQEENLKHLVVLALRTCATNALRHGNGNKLNVMIEQFSDCYDIMISNNGKVPEEPIEAGGGLTNLKIQVERIGGSVEPEYGEEFGINILLPKEGEKR